MHDFFSDEQVSAPVISKDLQPWKNKDVTDECLVYDLMGCILQFWNHYRTNTDYSQAEAISDAYEGILKAKKKDALAPNFSKNQKIKCKECNSLFHPPTSNIGDERANKVYTECPYGRTPKYRNILIECPDCKHKQIEKVEKSAFSSLVYYYIRSSVQRNARKMHYKVKNNFVEVSLNSQDSDMLDYIEVKPEEQQEVLPASVRKALYGAIDKLVERQRLVLVLHHGLGDIYAKTTEKELECQHCDSNFTAVVDYNIAENLIECPNCECENAIDMRIPKSVKCHFCTDLFNTVIDYSKSKNYSKCPHCETENLVDMRMNQTDIAKVLSVSKQRVCSILRTVQTRLQDELGDVIGDYGII